MTPPADAARALHGSRARPAARPIVPAIPLAYTQKRKKQVVAPPKPDEPAPAVEPVAAPTHHSAGVQAGTMNGSSDGPAASQTEATPTPARSPAPVVEADIGGEALEARLPADAALQVLQPAPPITTPEDQSSVSRSSYNMPTHAMAVNLDISNASSTTDTTHLSHQPHFSAQPAVHHAHPGTGSLAFGGYPASNKSSPAPPLSAGGSQPFHHTAYHDGTRMQAPKNPNGGHMHNISNGFSLGGPPGSTGPFPRQDAFASQNGAPDSFVRRQMVSFGPPDNPAYADGQRFPQNDTSTPLSFHGSHSSAPTEQEATGPPFYAQYPPGSNTNGVNGHTEDVRLYHPGHPKVKAGSQPINLGLGHYSPQTVNQAPMPPSMDNLDGLLGYLQNQFADPQFADYVLELRYSDDRATPVRIPGHNLLFARSPALKKLMTAQVQESNPDGFSSRTIFIQSDDRFLRSDAFWMAVQRLYGAPLMVPGATTSVSASVSQPSSTLPGSPADRFDLALGYAAAGHLLQMPPVVNRGIDIASHFLSWHTVEKAFDFALDGSSDSQWALDASQNSFPQGTYGPDVSLLIHSAANFVITSFPPNFALDTSVPDPVNNRRLPFVKEPRPAASNHRLSSIKFGDHSNEEELSPSSSGNNPLTITLSKILLNLPFHLLKYILESSRLGNVSGWATAPLRHKVMHAVVEEREKRRQNVLQNTSLSNMERELNSKDWETVGWKESVRSLRADVRGEASILSREWVGLSPHDGN